MTGRRESYIYLIDKERMKQLRTGIFLAGLLLGTVAGSAQVDFTASVTSGCTPLKVKFTLDRSTIDPDTVTSITWNFGFGDDIEAIDPDTVTYTQAGTFTVILIIDGDRDNPVIKDNYIVVHRTVSGAFSYEEYQDGFNYRFIPLDPLTADDATYTYTWDYYDPEGGSLRTNVESGIDYTNQSWAIDSVTLDTGIYIVNLTVSDPVNGCVSRSSRRLIVSEEVVLPNVFVFGTGRFYIIDPQDINTVLNFQVFNRYGLQVFEQTAPVINWNGETSWGRPLNTGVYYYILKAVEGDPQERYSKNGFIHLYPVN